MIKQIKGDLWDYLPQGYTVIVPTNGHVNSNGRAVMGRGIASQAAKLFRNLDQFLAKLLKEKGNNLFYFERIKVITFPTKNFWKDPSDLKLIEKSTLQLKELMIAKPELKIAMPKVGCGNGKLNWDEVAPIINKIFKDLEERIVIVDNEQGDSRYYRGKNEQNIKGEPEEDNRGLLYDSYGNDLRRVL